MKLSSMGDIVHVTPSVRALRQAWPNAEILMAVERRFADVVRHHPDLDGLIEAGPPKPTMWETWRDADRTLRPSRKPRFDIALDFQGSRKSALWTYASRAKVKVGRGGYRPGWDRVLKPSHSGHAVTICARVAEAVGVEVIDPCPRLAVSPSDDRRVSELLRHRGLDQDDLFLVHPFTAWRSKEWPIVRLAEALRMVPPPTGAPWVVVSPADEEARAATLVAALPPGSAIPVSGLTVGELLCLLRRGRLLIAGDSGPMHAAAALGVRIVALFGPNWPEYSAPWGPGHVVLQARRPSVPDFYKVDHDCRYMAALDVDTVVEALRDVVGRPRLSPEIDDAVPAVRTSAGNRS